MARGGHRELKGGEADRVEGAEEGAGVGGGTGVTDTGGDDGKLALHAGVRDVEHAVSGENDDPGEAEHEPDKAAGGEALFGKEHGRDDRRGDGHGGVEHRGETAIDGLLAPGDEREGEDVAEDGDRHHPGEQGRRPLQLQASHEHEADDGDCAEREAAGDDLDGRDFVEQDLDEEERGAPGAAEGEEKDGGLGLFSSLVHWQ